jgi:membrane-bound lytic murein transglycosylase A
MSFRTLSFQFIHKLGLAVLVLCLSACIMAPKAPSGIGPALAWQAIPGWALDQHADSLPALLASCGVLSSRSANWQNICSEASRIRTEDHQSARIFYEQWFSPHAVFDEEGNSEGLLTGYYEPLLYGSRRQSDRYTVPVYAKPKDLIQVDLGAVYPELKEMRLRGQIVGNRVIPYPDRKQIADTALPEAEVLVWLDDPIDLFFLQIQGSGRVALNDGTSTRLGYADQNGHPYRAIGRELVERGELALDGVSMFSIRDWLDENPDQASAILNTNPSYVFFLENKNSDHGPIGSLNVPLSAERSLAIDPGVIEPGFPVWVDTSLPASEAEDAGKAKGVPYQRLMQAQDTGGAIKGYIRADIFFGAGERARRLAGLMKQRGKLYVLKPRLLNPEN